MQADELAQRAMWARKVLGMADDEPNEATGHDTRKAFDRLTAGLGCPCSSVKSKHPGAAETARGMTSSTKEPM